MKYEHLVFKAVAEDDESWPLYHDRQWARKRGEALCPKLMSVEDLRQIEGEMSPFEFATQYQQTCTAKGGNQIRWDDIITYSEEYFLDSLPFMRIVHSWDTAVTAGPNSDYSVCTIWGYSVRREWFLLDVYRGRHEFAELEAVVVSMIGGKWKPDAVVIELQGAGLPLVSKLRQRYYQGRPSREGFRPQISTFNPVVDKEERFHLYKYKLEQQPFLIPEKTSWLQHYRHEFKTFPAGKNDDQVDSTIQFLAWLETRPGKAIMDLKPKRRVRH